MTPYRLSKDLVVNMLKNEINNTAPQDQTSQDVLVGKKLQATKTILFRVCAFCRHFIPALAQRCASPKKLTGIQTCFLCHRNQAVYAFNPSGAHL